MTVWIGRNGGSGTVIACEDGRSLVVTNRHVCAGQERAGATVRRGSESYRARFLDHAPDWSEDLAFLVIEAELPAAELLERDLVPGEELWMNGGGSRMAMLGRYVRTEGNEVKSTLAPVSGDSGAGVFAKDGDTWKLCAVCWGFDGSYRLRGFGNGVRIEAVREAVRHLAATLFPRFSERMANRQKASGPPPAKKEEPKKDPPRAGLVPWTYWDGLTVWLPEGQRPPVRYPIAPRIGRYPPEWNLGACLPGKSCR